MSQRISRVIIAIALMGLCGARLWAQQEVVVTIEGISAGDKLTHFTKGEELRKQMKFREAIEEYKMVIGGGEPCGKESEAHYNMGLCYTWLQELDKATVIFNDVIKVYSDDAIATAYAEFGLAWVEIRQGKYQEAINRLQRKLDEKSSPDYEHNAVMQFQIGRIYLKYLHNATEADHAFQKVLDNFANSQIAGHPYLDHLKKNN